MTLRTLTLLPIVLISLLMSGCINMPIKESGERAFQREFAGMTYIKVPYVEQESAVTCGVAVIQSVSDFWGSPIDQQTMLVDHPPADTEEGYSLAELKTIVKRHSRLKAFVLKANGKLLEHRGVAIFAKVCFGHPSPSKQQKLNATVYAYGAPTVLRSLRNHLFAALHNSLSDSTPT